jgi:hypothetical protein
MSVRRSCGSTASADAAASKSGSPSPSTSSSFSVPSGASPPTTMTCSRFSRFGLTLRKRSANCWSMIAIFAPASPTTYSICSGEAVTYNENGVAPTVMAARSARWNSNWLGNMSAIVSPRLSPSLLRPAASASVRLRRSAQVIENSSPFVRIAVRSPFLSTVRWNASMTVFEPTSCSSFVSA